MIFGIGLDVIEVERIKKISENKRYLEKVFTLAERELFLNSKNSVQTIAGNFTAKEAVSKALGTGIGKIAWKDIEVLRDKSGKPVVNLHSKALNQIDPQYKAKVLVSITHIRTLAIAQAIIEVEVK